MKKFSSIFIFCLLLAFISAYDISDLKQDEVFTFSATSTENFGKSVKNLGDIDNDGYDDFIIGAPQKAVSGVTRGAAYVVYGAADSTTLTSFDFSMMTLDPLTTGFTITGASSFSLFGFSVSGAGDIDHDGYDDIIIGAPTDTSGRGVVYVIFGGERPTFTNMNLQTNPLVPSSTGFKIIGEANMDNLGYSVSSAGDLNNDGHADIIMGANARGVSLTGGAYVIYGGLRSTFADIDLATNPLDPLTQGFYLLGNAQHSFFGCSVSAAGDLNSDGYDDIIIGARGDAATNTKGVAYIIYGGPKTSLPNRDLATNPITGMPGLGFTVTGGTASDGLGTSVSSAGDINGDTYDDILIGAPNRSGNKGAAYVIYGTSTPLSDIDLSSPLGLAMGFTMIGATASDFFGYSVGKASDVNGDGFSDIIIGANNKASGLGEIYMIYGANTGDLVDLQMSNGLDPLSKGFALSGFNAGGEFGASVSHAGDVNGDGFADLIIGANGENKAYLLTYNRCPEYCGLCQVPSKCNSCLVTFLQTVDDQCVCAAGSYPENSICEACPDNCDTCSDSDTCTVCSSTYYLYHGGCLGSCPPSTFIENDNCIDCPNDCDECDDSLTCTKCSTGYFLASGLCYETCPIKTYSSGTNCLGCSSNCDRCASGTICHQCSSGFHLWNRKCGSSCPIQTFADTPSTCGACPSDCDQCSSGTECSACSGSYFLYQYQCYYSCPLKTFPDIYINTCYDCPPNCAICADQAACQSCSQGYLFSGPDCVDACPAGKYPSNGVCQSCPSQCFECSNPSNCQSCASGFLKYNSQCLTECPAETYQSNSACFDCSEGCLKCKSASECQVCEDGFILSESHECIQHFEETAKDKAPSALFESTSLIGASVTSGSSVPLNFGLVAKILRNIKYMDLKVSPSLQKTFYSWKVASGFMSAPDSLRQKNPSEGLPFVFARYFMDPVFLVNYWKPLMFTIIGFGLFVIFKALEIKFEKEKEKKGRFYKISRQINVAASNFALTQFYSNLDDVILYFAIELRSTHFDSAFRVFSCGVALILGTIGVIILGFHSSFLTKYQSFKKGKAEPLETFRQKHENYKLIFADFKDTNFLTQSFLFFNLLRALLSSLIIATLYQNPGVQIAFLLILNLAMLTFLALKKPFKELTSTCGQIFCELVLLIANINVIILIICGQEDNSAAYGVIKRVSQCIIVLNFILLFGCAALLLISIGKIVYKAYQEKKNEKKLSEKSTDIKGLFNSSKFTRPNQSFENKTDQSSMPIVTNDLSGELFNNGGSRMYQNNQSYYLENSPDLSYSNNISAFASPNMLAKQVPVMVSGSFIMENPLDFQNESINKNNRKESGGPPPVIEPNAKLVNEIEEGNVVQKSPVQMRRKIGGKKRVERNNGSIVSENMSAQMNSKKMNGSMVEMNVIHLDDVLEN